MLPRLLALSALATPLSAVPLVFTGLAFLATIAAMAYVATAAMPAPRWQVVSLAFVIVPHNGEVSFTITNLQWIVAVCLAVAAASPPAGGKTRRCLDMAVVFVGGLSGPFSILFLPAFAFRAWISRESRQARWMLAAATLTATIQLAYLAFAAPAAGPSPGIPFLSAVAHVIIGKGLGGWFAFDPRPPLPWGAAVGVLLLIVFARPLARPDAMAPILILGFCALAILGAALVKLANDPSATSMAVDGYGGRYFYPAGVTLALALWIAAGDPSALSRYAAVLALCLLAANAVWHTKRLPRPDLDWAGQVRRYEAREVDVLRVLPGSVILVPPRPMR
ncbi:MAG: hypothetical protein FJX54_09460 [Alphaproteobacteria bacterium]|nr:hypothetical protein [Alphaproteobacteria bacterium]